MIVRCVRGRVRDADAVAEAIEEWNLKLAPKCLGFLGGTWGIGDDGQLHAYHRFSTRDDMEELIRDHERLDWYANKFLPSMELEPQVNHAEDVIVWNGGGCDSAKFVQIIYGRTTDIEGHKELIHKLAMLQIHRPDIIGGYTMFHDQGRFEEVVYFKDAEAAREGEAKAPDGEHAHLIEEWQRFATDIEFVDLNEPHLITPAN